MKEVKLTLDEKGHGHFYINENNEQVAEMIIGISGNDLTVYRAAFLPKAEGK